MLVNTFQNPFDLCKELGKPQKVRGRGGGGKGPVIKKKIPFFFVFFCQLKIKKNLLHKVALNFVGRSVDRSVGQSAKS